MARDSGVHRAREARRASSRASTRPAIVIRATNARSDGIDTGIDIEPLIKYQRSNQSTCVNQKPIVKVGDG